MTYQELILFCDRHRKQRDLPILERISKKWHEYTKDKPTYNIHEVSDQIAKELKLGEYELLAPVQPQETYLEIYEDACNAQKTYQAVQKKA